MKIGDVIEFINGKEGNEKDTIYALITKINHYTGPTRIEKFLNIETLERTLPGITSFEEGLKIYQNFWTPEEINKYDFLGIHIQLLPKL